MKRSNHAWFRRVFVLLALLGLLSLTVLAGVKWWFLPSLDHWRPLVEQHLTASLQRKVVVHALTGQLRGLTPYVSIQGLSVQDVDDKPVLHWDNVAVRLSWSSLWHGELRFKSLRLNALSLQIRRATDGQLWLAGMPLNPQSSDHEPPWLRWLLRQGDVHLEQASLVWLDELQQAPPLEIAPIRIHLRQRFGQHALQLQWQSPALGPGEWSAGLTFRAPLLTGDEADWRRWQGEMTLGSTDWATSHWRPWWPVAMPMPEMKGRVSVTCRFAKAALERCSGQWADAVIGLGDVRLTKLDGQAQLQWGSDGRLQTFRAEKLAWGRISAPSTHNAEVWRAARVQWQAMPLGQRPAAALLPLSRSPANVSTKQHQLDLDQTDLAGVTALLQTIADALNEDASPALNQARAWFTADQPAAQWLQRQPQGAVERLRLQWRMVTQDQASVVEADSWSVDGRIAGLGWRAASHLAASTPENPHPLGMPAMQGLTAEVSGDARGGRFMLQTPVAGKGTRPSSSITFPGLFEPARLPVESFDAQGSWQVISDAKHGRELLLSFQPLQWSNDDLAFRLRGSVRWQLGHASSAAVKAEPSAQARSAEVLANPKSPQGSMDLSVQLERASVKSVADYIPLLVSDKARTWLKQALIAGQVTQGKASIRGPLADFPYDKRRTGEYNIELSLQDGHLHYGPGWPDIQSIRGQVLIDRDSLTVKAKQAQVYGVRLSEVQARVPAMSDPAAILSIDGQGQGPFQDYLGFVRQSPLHAMLGEMFRETQANGQAALRLGLQIPLADAGHPKVNGRLDFQDAELQWASYLPWVSKLKGAVAFSDQGFQLQRLQGSALGGELKVQGGSAAAGATGGAAGTGPAAVAAMPVVGPAQPSSATSRGDLNASISIQGDAQLGPLREYVFKALALPLSTALLGRVGYQLEIQSRHQQFDWALESSLQGLEIQVPGPWRKVATETWPLQLKSQTKMIAQDGRLLPVKEELKLVLTPPSGQRSAALPVLARADRLYKDGQWRWERGYVALGDEPAMPAQGLLVSIQTAQAVHLDQLRQATESLLDGGRSQRALASSGSSAKPAPEWLPDVVELATPALTVLGRQFGKTSFRATRQQRTWSGEWRSNDIAGSGTWQMPSSTAAGQAGSLMARFSRLSLPPSVIEDLTPTLDAPPDRQPPALDITAERFIIEQHDLGSLRLRASNDVGGEFGRMWRLQELTLKNQDAEFRAQGTWGRLKLGQAPRTALDFTLQVHDAGQLLDRLGRRDVFRRGKGSLQGQLAWLGSPLSLDDASLSGKFRLESKQGQFLKADPGVAKLLGVLSLQALPRRITLDFRDIFSEGFAYDEVTADVQIEQGIARTQNFRMRGVAATVLLEGEANIDQETQRLRVLVLPQINAAAGSLVYGVIAANPAIGLGTLVAQMLLKDPLAKALSFEYLITGDWENPQVQRVKRELSNESKHDE